ncbi:MAG: hypothetical protein AAF357_12785 [Verrucomicrobiota bacterium]
MIEAARNFVCIRIATYEDKTEAQFVIDRVMSEGDDLRNFGYALASPGFETIVERSNRGPNFTYGSAEEMAAKLNSISEEYTSTLPENSLPGLPKMKDVRLAMNVASCDGLPCLVVFGNSEEERQRLQQKMGVVAWDPEIAGKFIYASTSEAADLAELGGDGISSGYLVVQPDPYGLKGEIITTISEPRSAERLKSELLSAVENYHRVSKTHGQHVRSGRQNGVVWETEVEVPKRDRIRG